MVTGVELTLSSSVYALLILATLSWACRDLRPQEGGRESREGGGLRGDIQWELVKKRKGRGGKVGEKDNTTNSLFSHILQTAATCTT